MSTEHRIREAIDTFMGRVRHDLEAHVRGLTSDIARLVEADRDQWRSETLEHLLGTVRRIDEADSLSGILEALARGASAETSRVAILLIDGETLRSWGHFGYATGQGPFDMPVGEVGVLAAAVALKQTSFVPAVIAGRESASPVFMRVPIGHTGFVVPIIVGREVVAVLYADDVGQKEEHEDAPIWTGAIDLMVRHASLRLENVTSVKTVEVLSQ
jgi:hypothetical protein